MNRREFGKYLLAAETASAVVTTMLVMAFFPFATIIRRYGFREVANPDLDNWIAPPTIPATELRRVGIYSERIAKFLRPGRPCLLAAFAAHQLLRRRGLSTTLVLGMTRTQDATLQAHAWLLCNEHSITGRRDGAGFNAVALFRYSH